MSSAFDLSMPFKESCQMRRIASFTSIRLFLSGQARTPHASRQRNLLATPTRSTCIIKSQNGSRQRGQAGKVVDTKSASSCLPSRPFSMTCTHPWHGGPSSLRQ